jgi:hypothetical protein
MELALHNNSNDFEPPAILLYIHRPMPVIHTHADIHSSKCNTDVNLSVKFLTNYLQEIFVTEPGKRGNGNIPPFYVLFYFGVK